MLKKPIGCWLKNTIPIKIWRQKTEENFKLVNVANDVLGVPEKIKQYDELVENRQQNQQDNNQQQNQY